MTPPSTFWIPVWNGLVNDPKHRAAMGEAIWTYLNLLDWCNKETGKVPFVTCADIAERSGIPESTVRKHLKKLKNGGYIIVRRYMRGLHIEITNYRSLRVPINGQSKGQNPIRPSTDGQSNSELPNSDRPQMVDQGDHRWSVQNKEILDNRHKEKDISRFLEKAESIYDHYKNHIRAGAKADAVKSISHLITKEGYIPEQLIQFIDNYRQSQDFPTEIRYRKQANNFFGQKRYFVDYFEAPEISDTPDDVPDDWDKPGKERKKEMGLIK